MSETIFTNIVYDCSIAKLSLDSFTQIYKRLGSHFDYHFFESESGDVGSKLILEYLDKGIFEKGERGAIIFKGESHNLHTRVFINSQGLPTYEAKELGLADIKWNIFKFDKSVTVTANEQDDFFKVVEVATGEVFPELKGKLHHLSHGMLRLPSGKMSSRTGDVIIAEELLEKVKSEILEKISDRELDGEGKAKSALGRSPEEEIAEIVAIGAIKYSILKQSIGRDIIFDFDKSLSFEGDSGPYLQYAFVRTKAIMEKACPPLAEAAGDGRRAKSLELQASSLISEKWEVTNLERLLHRFPEIVKRAGEEYAPQTIATFIVELGSAFNTFYAEEQIVDEKDPNSSYKIALTKAVGQILQNGLYLLGIKVPDRM